MSYKTIIVHCDASKKAANQLSVATELASRFDATLVGLHARAQFEMPVIEQGFGMGPMIEAFEKSVEADQQTARRAFEKAVKGTHQTAEWRAIDGFADDVLRVNARYADLVVLGQFHDSDSPDDQSDLPEAVALSTGRPILVVPHIGAAKRPGKIVMLCWNASRESARAASDALPFLKAAEKVIVLVVDPQKSTNGHGEEPGADAATWLTRHGVKVTVQREVAPNTDVGSVILSRAADFDVDLIVMGVYGHSRMRELVVGGASRTLLSSMTVPVLMSH